MTESDRNETMTKMNKPFLEENFCLFSVVIVDVVILLCTHCCVKQSHHLTHPKLRHKSIWRMWWGNSTKKCKAPWNADPLLRCFACCKSPLGFQNREKKEQHQKNTCKQGCARHWMCSHSRAHHEWEVLPEITGWDSIGVNKGKRDN